VCIATPHFLHYPMVMAALRAGKHVFCEKPLAIRADHAAEMAAAARQRGLVLTCHYNQRVRSYVAALRQIVQCGCIGRPYQINARWMARWTRFMFDPRTNWRLQRDKSGGGILIGRGSHLIDAALYVLGFPKVRTVSAQTHTPHSGGEVDDFANATFRLESGIVLNVQCSYVAHVAAFQERMEYEIYGTEGGAVYPPAGDGPHPVSVGRTDLATGAWHDLSATIDWPQVQREAQRTIIGDFLDAIAARRDPLVTAEQAAYVTAVIEAAYASAEQGREVDVE
jgi:predicted dehydrogenase